MIEVIRSYHSATSTPRYTRCVCVPITLKALDIQLLRVQVLKKKSFSRKKIYIFTLVDLIVFR